MMPREGVLSQATRIDPVPADHEALDSLSAREDLGGGELVLRTADGTEISLPSSLLRLVVSAANNLAAGRAVMAIPAEVMLTPTEAAELLGLSRPFVARLLERGDIPSELLPESRHRRIKLGDVLAFQDRRERRLEGRSRIADIAATADLPYLCLLFVARVFIDTNVLFPFSVMDLMLALTMDGIHDVMWSDDLLAEWERVISCWASRIAGYVERQGLRMRIFEETRDQDRGPGSLSSRPLRRASRRGARNDYTARGQQAPTAHDPSRTSQRARTSGRR
jgi:excisionase family DNA binding protein